MDPRGGVRRRLQVGRGVAQQLVGEVGERA
jgi:hypothetical protein